MLCLFLMPCFIKSVFDSKVMFCCQVIATCSNNSYKQTLNKNFIRNLNFQEQGEKDKIWMTFKKWWLMWQLDWPDSFSSKDPRDLKINRRLEINAYLLKSCIGSRKFILYIISHCLPKTSKKSAETPHFDLLMKYIWCISLRKWRLKAHKETISNRFQM